MGTKEDNKRYYERNKDKKNKRASMVLRDIVMLIIVFTGIIALASIFVNDISDTYSNTNMTSSYNQDAIGETQLAETSNTWEDIANDFDGNLLEMLLGTYKAAKEILTTVILAPATFVNMLTNILTDMGVDGSTTQIFDYILTVVLYVLILFTIVSAFLKGGRV